MGFLPEGALKARFGGGGSTPSNLEQAVAKLNPKAKQAMFSAATHGLIKRRSWSGCAFNQAGVEIGKEVRSSQVAAAAFGCSVKVVNDFIRIWDSMSGSDAACTQALREAIENVGLFTEPEGAKKYVGVVRSRVYTSYETKMREAFDASNAEAPVEGAAEAAELLVGSCA